jgi:hypothetical protein
MGIKIIPTKIRSKLFFFFFFFFGHFFFFFFFLSSIPNWRTSIRLTGN